MSVSTEQSQGTDLGSQAPGKVPSPVPGSVWDTEFNAHTELLPFPSCFQLGQLFKGTINNYQYTSVKYLSKCQKDHMQKLHFMRQIKWITIYQKVLIQHSNKKITWRECSNIKHYLGSIAFT